MLSDLKRAIRRLEASDTPRKRKSARAKVKALLQGAWKDLDTAYPPLRPDGSAVERKPARGTKCPVCNVPMKSFAMLARHLVLSHGHHRCCGPEFRRHNPRHLARHLAGLKNLNLHFAEHAMLRAAGAE